MTGDAEEASSVVYRGAYFHALGTSTGQRAAKEASATACKKLLIRPLIRAYKSMLFVTVFSLLLEPSIHV